MWLDHKKAVIVMIAQQGESDDEIVLELERQTDCYSESQSQQSLLDDLRLRAYNAWLN